MARLSRSVLLVRAGRKMGSSDRNLRARSRAPRGAVDSPRRRRGAHVGGGACGRGDDHRRGTGVRAGGARPDHGARPARRHRDVTSRSTAAAERADNVARCERSGPRTGRHPPPARRAQGSGGTATTRGRAAFGVDPRTARRRTAPHVRAQRGYRRQRTSARLPPRRRPVCRRVSRRGARHPVATPALLRCRRCRGEHDVDVPARLLAAAPLAYPPAARQSEIELDFPLEIVVDAQRAASFRRAH